MFRGRITATLLARFQRWERMSQVGFLLVVVLLIPMVGVTFFGGDDLRVPAAVGTMGLIIVGQGIIMWENRHMVTEFTRAQRLFRRGKLQAARDLLEARHAAGTQDVRELTLLGNLYRQLGLLDDSHEVLSEALNIAPDHYFPLYGFGRTLLVQGQYTEAADAIEQALANDAPEVTRSDLGEAYYRAGQQENAIPALQEAEPAVRAEPHRVLMVRYLLYRLGQADAPTRSQVEAGLPFWEAEAKRFAATPYGQALAKDLDLLLAQT